MTTIPRHPLADALRAAGFVGRLVEPGDAGYDAARAGWNGAIDRRPAAVAYADATPTTSPPRSAPPRRGLPFTIRAGGHSVSGRSVRDGALCIDLRALNAVDVDPERGIVRVGGGALLARARRGHAGARARRAGRPDLAHRRRRADARRRASAG